MTDRELTSPVPDLAEVPSTMLPATIQWERIALKWRNLAEQRRDHSLDLYQSGRWKHYYTEAEFLTEMRKAAAIAERWIEIAPLREERRAGRGRTASGGLKFPAVMPAHAGIQYPQHSRGSRRLYSIDMLGLLDRPAEPVVGRPRPGRWRR